jgi:hypothetical protein
MLEGAADLWDSAGDAARGARFEEDKVQANVRAVAVGVFREREQLLSAIGALKAAGLAGDAIEVLTATPGAMQAVAEGAAASPDADASPVEAVGDLPAASMEGKLSDVVLGGGKGVVAATLTGLGFAPSDADWYDEEVASGATLVLVNAQNRCAEAEGILRQSGAERTAQSPTA